MTGKSKLQVNWLETMLNESEEFTRRGLNSYFTEKNLMG
jgi:hypothetical protein